MTLRRSFKSPGVDRTTSINSFFRYLTVAAQDKFPAKYSRKSNRIGCQEIAREGFHGSPLRIMLPGIVRSFRIQAVRATFLGLPAASNRR